MTPFAAVLLAGGQSRRMGRDKALLRLPDGRLLWERQLGLLRELEPAELFISGARREGFPPGVPCLEDELPLRGPLGGIATALGAMRSPRLLVLAIDLPRMTSAFLRRLLVLDDNRSPAKVGLDGTMVGRQAPLPGGRSAAATEPFARPPDFCRRANQPTGVVPKQPGGIYEPLAAVYSQDCHSLAIERLRADDWSMQRFIRTAGPLLWGHEIQPDEAALFANWNQPTDAEI